MLSISPVFLTITALREFPTSLTREEIEQQLAASSTLHGWHESLLRSYQTLQKVKYLLSIGTPAEVVLEIIVEAGE